MTEKHSKKLVDEADLRAALQPLRPDPDSFVAGIRQRIQEAEIRLCKDGDSKDTRLDRSDWLRVAAVVIPLPLLSKGGGGGLVKLSLGQISLGKKIVAVAALPAIGLLLMVTATIWAIIKIRRAQHGQSAGEMDALKVGEITAGWWRQFGVLVASMSGVLLLLMLTGYTIPVFIIFLVSGITMVSLITRLGKERLVDRNTIAATLCPGLLILVQLTHMTTMFNHGFPFLDQMLIPAVLVLGGLAMMVMSDPSGGLMNRSTILLFKSFLGVFLLLMAGWYSSSLWNPVSTQDLKTHVESFDHARFSSASWRQWQVPVEWLRDSKLQLNLFKPHALLKAELAQVKPNQTILCYAIEAGLFQPQDLEQIHELVESQNRMFSDYDRGKPFISVDTLTRFTIHALVLRDELSDFERDCLGARLAVTMESLRTKSYGNILEEQLAITKLALLIDRPLDIQLHRDFVHETLVSYQRLSTRFGQHPGGFTFSAKLNSSDEQATVDAIELMQIYGVPDDVQIDALRSYLRPNYNEKWSRLLSRACIREASLQRLESLPEVRSITWLDYFRYEQNLMMTILFTLVCVFATLGAAQLSSGSTS